MAVLRVAPANTYPIPGVPYTSRFTSAFFLYIILSDAWSGLGRVSNSLFSVRASVSGL